MQNTVITPRIEHEMDAMVDRAARGYLAEMKPLLPEVIQQGILQLIENNREKVRTSLAGIACIDSSEVEATCMSYYKAVDTYVNKVFSYCDYSRDEKIELLTRLYQEINGVFIGTQLIFGNAQAPVKAAAKVYDDNLSKLRHSKLRALVLGQKGAVLALIESVVKAKEKVGIVLLGKVITAYVFQNLNAELEHETGRKLGQRTLDEIGQFLEGFILDFKEKVYHNNYPRPADTAVPNREDMS